MWTCRAYQVWRARFNWREIELSQHRQIIEPSSSTKASHRIHGVVQDLERDSRIGVCVDNGLLNELHVRAWRADPVNIRLDDGPRPAVGRAAQALILAVISESTRRSSDACLIPTQPLSKARWIRACGLPIPALSIAEASIDFSSISVARPVMLPKVDEKEDTPAGLVKGATSFMQDGSSQRIEQLVVGVRASPADASRLHHLNKSYASHAVHKLSD